MERINEGDEVVLLLGPPVDGEPPSVWVHLPGGDLVGHLPPEIETWLAPWMLRGGRVKARAVRVFGRDVPSWRRLVLEVTCCSA